MLSILTITGPIYLLILLGWLAVRLGWLAKADMRVIGQFVVRIALPALLFRIVSRQPVGQVLSAGPLLAYALGSLAALGAGWAWARWRQPEREGSWAAVAALGGAASNSGFVGTPVLLQWLGPAAGSSLAVAMVVENLLILPLALTLAELGAHASASTAGQGRSRWQVAAQALKPLAKNPMLLAILAGVVCAALEWQPPAVVSRSIDLLANASAGAALVVIGGTLVGLKLGGQRLDMASVAVAKLVVHPLAVMGLMAVLVPQGGLTATGLMALAAMPMISIYPVLAQKYHHDGFCAATLLATTVASFFSLSLLLAWLPGPAL